MRPAAGLGPTPPSLRFGPTSPAPETRDISCWFSAGVVASQVWRLSPHGDAECFPLLLPGLDYPRFAFSCTALACGMAWIAILAHIRTAWKLSQDVSFSPKVPRMTEMQFVAWAFGASALFFVAVVLFLRALVSPLEHGLLSENRVLTYWRAMHLTSGVSPIVPILLVFTGMYAAFWLTLHGLALFGPDRPCLPKKGRLVLHDAKGNNLHVLRMFSQEEAGARIERAAMPLTWKII